MVLLDKLPFHFLLRHFTLGFMMLFGHGLIAQDAEMEAYVKRIIDKTYTLENLIISNAQRVDYLYQVLQEDMKELPESVTPEEKNALKLRIAKVKKLNQEAQKIKKKAGKSVGRIEKISNPADEKTYERTEEIKALVDELTLLNMQMSAITDESLVIPSTATTDSAIKDNQPPVVSADTKPEDPTSSESATVEPPIMDAPTQQKKKEYAKYDRKQDVLFNPPVTECNGIISDTDPFSGKDRRLTQPTEVFHFTNSFMANALKGKEHITCFASVIETQKKTFLHLKFVINDANGSRNFGSIRQDVPIIIKLVDETKIPLTNGLTDAGSMDPSGTVFTVSASMQIWKAERDAFLKMEVDKIRIPWQRGFEEYEVYNVALIQRLLRCF